MWQCIAAMMGPGAWARSGALACKAFAGFHFQDAVLDGVFVPSPGGQPGLRVEFDGGAAWLAKPSRWRALQTLGVYMGETAQLLELGSALARTPPSEGLEHFSLVAHADADWLQPAGLFLLLLQRLAPALKSLTVSLHHSMPPLPPFRQLQHLALDAGDMQPGLLACIPALACLQTLTINRAVSAEHTVVPVEGMRLGDMPELTLVKLSHVRPASLALPARCELLLAGSPGFVVDEPFWRSGKLGAVILAYPGVPDWARGAGVITPHALGEVLPRLYDSQNRLGQLSVLGSRAFLAAPFSLALPGLQALRSLSLFTPGDISMRVPAALPLSLLRLRGRYLSLAFQDVRKFAAGVHIIDLQYELLTSIGNVRALGRALHELRGLDLVIDVCFKKWQASQAPTLPKMRLAYIMGRRVHEEPRDHPWEGLYR
jgi:hypothetical protein